MLVVSWKSCGSNKACPLDKTTYHSRYSFMRSTSLLLYVVFFAQLLLLFSSLCTLILSLIFSQLHSLLGASWRTLASPSSNNLLIVWSQSYVSAFPLNWQRHYYYSSCAGDNTKSILKWKSSVSHFKN